MNENNKKENVNFLLPEKMKNKKFNNSTISPKKMIVKNDIKNKKGVFQIKKKSIGLFKDVLNYKIIKCKHSSPKEKLKTTRLNGIKLFRKNLSNDSNYIKTKNQKSSQKNSINNSIVNKDVILKVKEEENNNKIMEENKKINNKSKIIINHKKISLDTNNINNNKIMDNSSSTIFQSQRDKQIKINKIKYSKNKRN